MSKQNSFKEFLLQTVRNIPEGQVMSYTEVAKASGKPKACRAVARFMSKNFDPTVPCHWVIKADVTVGGYNRGGGKLRKKDYYKRKAV